MPVRIETRKEIAVLYMDNNTENCFNSEMIQQLNAALDDIEEEMDVTMFQRCDLTCLQSLS